MTGCRRRQKSRRLRETKGKMPCNDGGKGQSGAATSQERPETSEAERGRKDASIEPSEEVQPCQQLEFGLVAFRTLKE